MPAGGMSSDVKATRVAAKTCGVFVNPCDAATNLISHHAEVAARRPDRNEVECDVMRAGIDEHFCRIGIVLSLAAEPCTAVNAYEYWCIRARSALQGACAPTHCCSRAD